MHFLKIFQRRLGRKAWVLLCILPLLFSSGLVSALTPQDLNSIYNDKVWYDPDSAGACSGFTAPSGGGLPGGSYSLDRVKTFASEPITSTWNISESTIEHWYLKQAGAQPTITRYGLTPSNIGQITSAVKDANVSPIFFYFWAVNEGGGQGGFINHFSKEHNTGDGVKDAKADAEYMASQSKVMSSIPSWIDAGNPVDFVPQNVKTAGDADFKKMPSGSIGRLYIAAGAAAAWEIYYPDGLKKEFNKVRDYGKPLEQVMNYIQSMGSDPMQGGATLSAGSCTSSVAGEGITKAINWAVMIANNDGYGYDQTTPGDGRTSGWIKWQSDPSCTHQCGSFDCSSFIAAALTEAGYFKTNPNFATGAEAADLTGAGFKKIADSVTTSSSLLPGDILLWAGHTEMYIGNNRSVGAHINENGVVNGGQVGDQNHKEISVSASTFSIPGDPMVGVYRAQN